MIDFITAISTARANEQATILAKQQAIANEEALKPTYLVTMESYRINFNSILEENISNIKTTLGSEYKVEICSQIISYLGSDFIFDILYISRMGKRYGIPSVFGWKNVEGKYNTINDFKTAVTNGVSNLVCNIVLEDD